MMPGRVTADENGGEAEGAGRAAVSLHRSGTDVEVVLCLSASTAILRLTRADSLVSPSVASIQDEHA